MTGEDPAPSLDDNNELFIPSREEILFNLDMVSERATTRDQLITKIRHLVTGRVFRNIDPSKIREEATKLNAKSITGVKISDFRCFTDIFNQALEDAIHITQIHDGQNSQPIPDTPDDVLDYRAIALRIRDNLHLISYNETLFRYHDGVYIEDNGLVDAEIIRYLIEDENFSEDDKITVASQQVKHYILYENPCVEYPFNNYRNMWCLKNGVLIIDFETGDHHLEQHSPHYLFNYKLTVSYDGNADTTKIDQYLSSLESEENRIKPYLLQIPAHAMLGMTGKVYKKAYFLKGKRDSGKSTFIDMISTHFFGDSQCSTISLQELLYDKFRLAELDGKMMNSYADLSNAKIKDPGKFKMLTGGDRLTVERKYKNPYSFKNRALFVFSANSYPKIEVDNDPDSFFGRWIALKFTNHFEVDTEFVNRTFTEENMSGFLLLVIDHMKFLVENGLLTNDTIMEEWLADSNSSDQFISKCIEREPNAVLIKQHVFAKYKDYCDDNDLNMVSQKEFTTTIKYKLQCDGNQITLQGKREHCYIGVKWIGKDPIYADTTSKSKKDHQQESQKNIS